MYQVTRNDESACSKDMNAQDHRIVPAVANLRSECFDTLAVVHA